ncbi:hypothetical protein [Aliikangiella sp. G2MR2-5]|uniref:hypothetical protein n=1 Tax=Aliikangiella sp. G2MR2-5 TaxID=2788943 RepID=UPI0018A8E779|nr:hypothetical protein [Aliikangiella sp. G2MR2-5]
MKNTILSLTFASYISAMSTSVVIAEEHKHQHESHTAELALNQGKKWSIDESLHAGMSRIQNDLKESLDSIHYDRFTAPEYAQLAEKMESHLGFLFKNCKLKPDADAQLHILLSEVIQGTDLMKNSDNKKQGAILIFKALKKYPDYFADPEWKAINH